MRLALLALAGVLLLASPGATAGIAPDGPPTLCTVLGTVLCDMVGQLCAVTDPAPPFRPAWALVCAVLG